MRAHVQRAQCEKTAGNDEKVNDCIYYFIAHPSRRIQRLPAVGADVAAIEAVTRSYRYLCLEWQPVDHHSHGTPF